jgi:hypothetical protein
MAETFCADKDLTFLYIANFRRCFALWRPPPCFADYFDDFDDDDDDDYGDEY